MFHHDYFGVLMWGKVFLASFMNTYNPSGTVGRASDPWFFWNFFLAFDFCRFCVVILFFPPRHNGQWPPTSKTHDWSVMSSSTIKGYGCMFSWAKLSYPHCLVLVGERNGFKHDLHSQSGLYQKPNKINIINQTLICTFIICWYILRVAFL